MSNLSTYKYIPTTNMFLAHWAEVDANLDAPGLVLTGDFSRSSLVTLRDQLLAARSEVQDKLNEVEIQRAEINLKKTALKERFDQFTGRIRALYPDTKWIEALPKAPDPTIAQSKFTDPLNDVANLWERIDASQVTELSLPGTYVQATFVADIQELNTLFATNMDAEQALKLTRQDRNEIQELIYPRLVSYRLAVPSFFEKGSPLIDTLPRLTPKPGHTPDPVELSGAWNPTEETAELAWTESTDTILKDYNILGCAADEWDSDLAESIATIPAGDPRTLQTTFGLALPNATATYRVEVRLTTGNTKLGNILQLQRPPE